LKKEIDRQVKKVEPLGEYEKALNCGGGKKGDTSANPQRKSQPFLPKRG